MSAGLEARLIEKLEKMVEDAFNDHTSPFTKEEAELLKKLAARERGWIAIGALAGTGKTILTYFGFFLATWAAFKTGLITTLSEWLGLVR